MSLHSVAPGDIGVEGCFDFTDNSATGAPDEIDGEPIEAGNIISALTPGREREQSVTARRPGGLAGRVQALLSSPKVRVNPSRRIRLVPTIPGTRSVWNHGRGGGTRKPLSAGSSGTLADSSPRLQYFAEITASLAKLERT